MTTVSGAVARLGYTLRCREVRLALLVNAVLFVLMLAVLLFYWWPNVRAQQAAQERIEMVRRGLTAAMQAKDIVSAYSSASRAVETVEKKLQAPVTQAQLVQSMAALARKHGVRIVSESYEEGRRQSDYTPLFLQVTLEGRYAGMRSLLSEISTLPLWTEVEDVRMERLRESAGSIKAQLRLRVVRRATVSTAASRP